MFNVGDEFTIDFWDFGETVFRVVEVDPVDRWTGDKKNDYKCDFVTKGTGFEYFAQATLDAKKAKLNDSK